VCGGSTPAPAYELAAALCPDWGAVELWFGDERAVAPDDPRSNHRLVSEWLLDRLDRGPRAVHRVRGELGGTAAADLYDDELRGIALDLALNGIGADGHTASLFPGAPGLDEQSRLAVAAAPALEPLVERVTLTRRAFAATSVLVYLVVGADKAEAVRRAFSGEPDPATPASLVRGRRTLALLDRDAAALL
jgi:6-phosphogluconolactonase